MANEENWVDIIRTNHPDLLINIDASDAGGLYGELKKEDVFYARCLRSYFGFNDQTRRVDNMLDDLKRRDFKSFQKFCTALVACRQSHVVDQYLSKVMTPESRSTTTTTTTTDSVDLPHGQSLSDVKLECLKQNWNKIIDHVECDESLLSQIESRNFFTIIQLNKLKDQQDKGQRVQMILGHLERGPESQYDLFCAALKASKQEFVVTEFMTPRVTLANPTVSVPSLVPPKQHEFKESAENIQGGGDAKSFNIRVSAPSKDFRKQIENEVAKKCAYKCDGRPLGRAIIINNQYFTSLACRDGADKDALNLTSLFNRLNFKTTLLSDINSQGILKHLEEESQHFNNGDNAYDMFVLFILSHGISGHVYGMDSIKVPLEQIFSLFDGKSCHGLVNKPKLFFIQACQGDVKSEGVTASDMASDSASEIPSSSADNPLFVEMFSQLTTKEDFSVLKFLDNVLPEFASDAAPDVVLSAQGDAVPADKEMVHEKADMAIFYATVDGQVAWRSPLFGSLFVKCIMDVFSQQAHQTDLMSMLREVNNKLHDMSITEKNKTYRVIGNNRDTLRRKVYLVPDLSIA